MDVWLTLRLVRQELPMLFGRPQVFWQLYAGPATPNPDDQVLLGTFDAQGDPVLDTPEPPDPPDEVAEVWRAGL